MYWRCTSFKKAFRRGRPLNILHDSEGRAVSRTSVLQCPAMCCSVNEGHNTRHTTTCHTCRKRSCCSVLQCVAVCSLVRHTTTYHTCQKSSCCSVLQCVAVCCSVLFGSTYHHISYLPTMGICFSHGFLCCSVLQCQRQMCCSVLQCVAVCYSVLQSTIGICSPHEFSTHRLPQQTHISGIKFMSISSRHCRAPPKIIQENKNQKIHTPKLQTQIFGTGIHANLLSHCCAPLKSKNLTHPHYRPGFW